MLYGLDSNLTLLPILTMQYTGLKNEMPSGVENLDGFNYLALSVCHIFNLIHLMNKQENVYIGNIRKNIPV